MSQLVLSLVIATSIWVVVAAFAATAAFLSLRKQRRVHQMSVEPNLSATSFIGGRRTASRSKH